jgi:excinuclease UvrABC ATPase subunit
METMEEVHELEIALEARDEAQRRYQSAVGTSTEMGAYMRLRAATRRVSKCDREVRRQHPELEISSA